MPNATFPNTLVTALKADDTLQIIDVRRRPAFEASSQMIAGAVWRDPDDIGHWLTTLDARYPVVVYCLHGLQVGKDCAAILEAKVLNSVSGRWH